MRIRSSKVAWFASAVFVVAGSSFVAAQEATSGTSPGVLRMTDGQPYTIQQTCCPTTCGRCRECIPHCGCYHITYAHDPRYSDARDHQAWAAQGYGMPMTVPTAPIVRYSYNYSHGTPASRLTPTSTYNPVTSPRSLFHQSWH